MERVRGMNNIKDEEDCGNPLCCLVEGKRVERMDDNYKYNYHIILL